MSRTCLRFQSALALARTAVVLNLVASSPSCTASSPYNADDEVAAAVLARLTEVASLEKLST